MQNLPVVHNQDSQAFCSCFSWITLIRAIGLLGYPRPQSTHLFVSRMLVFLLYWTFLFFPLTFHIGNHYTAWKFKKKYWLNWWHWDIDSALFMDAPSHLKDPLVAHVHLILSCIRRHGSVLCLTWLQLFGFDSQLDYLWNGSFKV